MARTSSPALRPGPGAVMPSLRPRGDGRTVLTSTGLPGMAPLSRPRPNLAAAGLAIVGPVPLPGEYPPGSAGFRYWQVAETLARGIALWREAIGGLPGTLPVQLVGAAGYDRGGLAVPIVAADRPDLVGRALGHAVLDLLRPDLWDTASVEIEVAHDAIARLTAVLAALKLPELRAAPAPLAQLAGCPAPDGFTAALLDMLAALIAAEPAARGEDAALPAAARKMARLLATALRRVPAAPNFLAQLAAELAIAAAVQEGPAMGRQLRALFAARRLLAAGGATAAYDPHEAEDGTEIPPDPPRAPPPVAIDGAAFGYALPLLLQPAAQPARLAAAAADDAGAPVDPPHPVAAARAFVAALRRDGRVTAPVAAAKLKPAAGMTHALIDDGRILLLRRLRFLCE